MNIIYKKLNEITPYIRNPRKNDGAVEYVAKSIKEFGFKVPIIVDAKNEIVCGHTRYKAAKKLKMEEIPCLLADDLSEEQIKAFRLADNKVAEKAEWDFDLLEFELNDIFDIDMFDFGFEIAKNTRKDENQETNEEQEEDIEDDYELENDKLDNRYGIIYQGSKNRIADKIIEILPAGERLVDLFGGGGAITHCALLSKKWNKILYNDINTLITQLFVDAVNGKYKDEKRIITREEFARLKDSDPCVKYIWSFGGSGTSYIWGKDIEGVKIAASRLIVEDDQKERRLLYKTLINEIKEYIKRYSAERLQGLQGLERLEGLEGLERLQGLEGLEGLEVSNIDYRDYKRQDGDVLYCDVPYENLRNNKNKCDDYGVIFDSLEFYEWAKNQDNLVFFSSYEISDKSFYRLKVQDVARIMSSSGNSKKDTEYLYCNKEYKNFKKQD